MNSHKHFRELISFLILQRKSKWKHKSKPELLINTREASTYKCGQKQSCRAKDLWFSPEPGWEQCCLVLSHAWVQRSSFQGFLTSGLLRYISIFKNRDLLLPLWKWMNSYSLWLRFPFWSISGGGVRGAGEGRWGVIPECFKEEVVRQIWKLGLCWGKCDLVGCDWEHGVC